MVTKIVVKIHFITAREKERERQMIIVIIFIIVVTNISLTDGSCNW